MNKKDFDFYLPEELIAQTPLLDRSSSKLLAMDRNTGKIEHKHFFDIVDMINEGDCLVINDTKVIPARLIGAKPTGGKVEVLLLKRLTDKKYETIVYPGKNAKIGNEIIFGDGILKCKVIDIVTEGNRVVEFEFDGIFEEILDKLGEMPLPPYITEKLEEKDRYQTVYAKNNGSSAAPTAGLHFTPEILEKLENKGVHIAHITLHVGLGTFRPVKADNILEHVMHSEIYNVSQEACDIINNTKKQGGRVISVGTTSTRTLESVADENGFLVPQSGETDIFIYPPYEFKVVDALLTNFHLPESTLIMLVSSLAGRKNVLNAYAKAVENKYRFFSFGDAMFIQ